MPNVLVLGATGYIGLAVCQALLRTGTYLVWGTARTAEKAKTLTTNEISAVIISDLSDQEALKNAITSNQIDIVIDTSSAYDAAHATLKTVIEAGKARAAALKAENAIGPKLGFVYTSGVWVYGSPSEAVSELSAVGNKLAKGTPHPFVTWRPAMEQDVLAARDVLDVAVLRPGSVYGRASWLYSTFWGTLAPAKNNSSSKEAIKIPASSSARHNIVHVDDNADAYVAVVERLEGRLGSWPIFDITTESFTLPEMMEAAKKVWGIEAPLEYAGPGEDLFLQALSLVSRTDGAPRARTVLGWNPKRRDFLANIGVYLGAWEAAQPAQQAN